MKEIKLKTDLMELVELLKAFEQHLALKTKEYLEIKDSKEFDTFVVSFIFDWLHENR